jgi:hypothetical protein
MAQTALGATLITGSLGGNSPDSSRGPEYIVDVAQGRQR